MIFASLIMSAALQILGPFTQGLNVPQDQKIGISLGSSSKTHNRGMTLKYSMPVSPVSTKDDLRAQWISALFHKMCDSRLGEDPYYDFLPASSLDITVGCSQSDYPHEFEDRLTEIEEIKREGFTAKEWESAKAQSLEFMEALAENSSSSEDYAERFLLGVESPGTDFFVSASKEVIENLELRDISAQAPLLLAEENRSIEISTARTGSSERAPILLVNNASSYGNPEAFHQLPLYDWEKDIIHKIITMMADKNVLELGLRKRTLERKGDKINQVHPLRFVGYIFADPQLKKCMREVRKSHFKWKGFLGGFSRRMKEESSRNNILPYLNGFAQMLNVDVNEVARLVQHKDWESIVKLLF